MFRYVCWAATSDRRAAEAFGGTEDFIVVAASKIANMPDSRRLGALNSVKK
jgi:hypothetical protein